MLPCQRPKINAKTFYGSYFDTILYIKQKVFRFSNTVRQMDYDTSSQQHLSTKDRSKFCNNFFTFTFHFLRFHVFLAFICRFIARSAHRFFVSLFHLLLFSGSISRKQQPDGTKNLCHPAACTRNANFFHRSALPTLLSRTDMPSSPFPMCRSPF